MSTAPASARPSAPAQPLGKKRDLRESAIERREALAAKVIPLIGDFDRSNMTAADVMRHACSKLGLQALGNNEAALVQGFLAGFETGHEKARQEIRDFLYGKKAPAALRPKESEQ
jgi:hypothetical protein